MEAWEFRCNVPEACYSLWGWHPYPETRGMFWSSPHAPLVLTGAAHPLLPVQSFVCHVYQWLASHSLVWMEERWFKGIQDATLFHFTTLSAALCSVNLPLFSSKECFQMPFSIFLGFAYLHFCPLESMLHKGRNQVCFSHHCCNLVWATTASGTWSVLVRTHWLNECISDQIDDYLFVCWYQLESLSFHLVICTWFFFFLLLF